MSVIEIRPDDLSGYAARSLASAHPAAGQESSPPGGAHATRRPELTGPSVNVWSAWTRGELAGIAALKTLEAHRGEITAMTVRDAFRGQGVGRTLLQHLISEAQGQRMTSLWIETGTSDEYLPTRHLYERGGFIECGPFEGYVPDPQSIFMRRLI